MEKVIASERIPIKLWLSDIEEGALEQAKNLANLPFAFKHIAIMPDSHQGYGMPIGGVLACQRTIIPNAVGVDIGCGMCAVKTDLQEVDNERLKKVLGRIRNSVPVGRNHHDKKQTGDILNLDNYEVSKLGSDSISYQENQSAHYQLGSLGGGNHFIEIQQGNDGYIWLMIHSGSRNVGYTVARHYNNLAQEYCKMWHSSVPKDLAFFPVESELFTQYRLEMEYCVDFAFANRMRMMERVQDALLSEFPRVSFDDVINKPHNFAAWENHFNQNVIVHRKGACRARKGEIGMIPGSQGDPSYIVEGKGEPQSFESCSHGAGRKMSRTAARKTLSLKSERANLNRMGVLHALRHDQDLDEAPSAYKNILEVMSNQEDLVNEIVELLPLAVVKG